MRLHDYPRLLQDNYINRLRETYRRRRERLAAINSRREAERYVSEVRDVIKASFGPLPEKTPLQARTWKVVQREDCRIENLTYESRPGYLVTANLYLPAPPAEGPFPGVLFTCGHYPGGKASPVYVQTCLRLVREGYAVLNFDPIGQGERDIYSLIDTGGRLTRDNPWDGHNVVGKQMQTCGQWFGTWRLWDGIRGLDYLISRPEVDASRLGVTGQSGGGTMSALIWSMDERLRMVASSCWTTSYLLDLENDESADAEQYPAGWLAAGLDKVDFFMARAGQPALLMGQEFDFFDNRGLEEAYGELLKMHRLLGGSEDTCRLSVDSGTHNYSPPNQREMVAFFNGVLGRSAAVLPDPEDIPEEVVLLATPEGDVHRAGSRPIYELTTEMVRATAAGRPAAGGKELPETIARALSVRPVPAVPHYRRLFHSRAVHEESGLDVFRFGVETEPGMVCILRHLTATGSPYRLKPSARILLYLPDADSQTELPGAIEAAAGEDLWMLDVRGLGEGLASPEELGRLYGRDYMLAGYAMMFGETLLGDRLRDVLAAVSLLRDEGAAEIRLVGRRQGGLLALLAAVLDESIAGVTALEIPESFQALAEAPVTFWPTVNFPYGVLKAFDLPQVRSFLGPRLVKETGADIVEFG